MTSRPASVQRLTNHPIVRRLIVDSLRYWVETMHVDGFRFDLASILARGPSGQVIPNPPVLWDIESEPRWRGRSSSPKRGMRPAWTRWAPSSGQLEGMERTLPRRCRSFFRGEEGSVERFATA